MPAPLADPNPTALGLSGLQSLNLSGAGGVHDLSPLAGLSGLQTLNLSGAGGVHDLSPLEGLGELRTLSLSGAGGVHDLTPLAGLGYLSRLDLTGSGGHDLSPLLGFAGHPLRVRIDAKHLPAIPAEILELLLVNFDGFGQVSIGIEHPKLWSSAATPAKSPGQ